MEFDLKKTLEALLLSTADPITAKSVVKIFARYNQDISEAQDTSKGDDYDETQAQLMPNLYTFNQVREALVQLTDEAEVQDKAYRIVEGPNGYQVVTAPQHAEFVTSITRKGILTFSLLLSEKNIPIRPMAPFFPLLIVEPSVNTM